MPTISLRQVGYLATRTLFRDLTFTIGNGDRLGVIAANGGGKSTFLGCLVGRITPSAGEIVTSRGLRTALVEQDVPAALGDLSFREAVRRALPPTERLAQEWRVDVLLDDLGAAEALRDKPIRTLSGGWQRLALIARAWITEPDLLLLDEPTNHLDLEKIELLERWVGEHAQSAALVIASHDREFLDACTNRTLFLRPDRSRLYTQAYSAARASLAEDDAAQEAKLTRDTREVTRLKRSAAELRNIGINSRSDAAQKKSSQMAQRAARLEQNLRPVTPERTADIRLANRDSHAHVLLSLKDVPVADPTGRLLFQIPQLTIFRGDRVVLVGRNGTGKSLLLRLLHQALVMADSVPGVLVSSSAVVGYMDQAMSWLPLAGSPFGFVSDQFRLGDQRCRSLLAGAGFPVERQHQPIATFSPGQRARLHLLALRLTEPNVYLLDEPTNHVDIPGQEALETEIVERGATCVLASHDRRFVRTVGTRFLSIGEGTIREIAGPCKT